MLRQQLLRREWLMFCGLPQFAVLGHTAGTPPTRFTLQVDTGSTVIALPAKQCRDCEDFVFYPLDPTVSASVQSKCRRRHLVIFIDRHK